MNNVLTMTDILDREHNMIMEHCAEVTRRKSTLVEGPHGGKHDARTAARLWREYEMSINTMSLSVLAGIIR